MRDKTDFLFAGSDRPGADQNDLSAGVMQETDLLGKVSDDLVVYAIFIGEDGAADLDNDPPRLVKKV